MIEFVKKLTSISPRYGVDEIKGAKIIVDELNRLKIDFVEEKFESSVPRISKAELFADGISIPCVGSGAVSGQIPDGKYLISGFGYTGEGVPYNISYSPITDEISVVDVYKVPSVTISRKSITQIVMANKVSGNILVDEEKYTTENILVGNLANPENIIFAHYDSIIGSGAVDNAAAVAVVFELMKSNYELIKNNLFIFAGNEELSYDTYKTRSGHGFREFEILHSELLKSAKQIIVIDGIGVSSPNFSQAGLDWVLQIKMLDEIRSRVFWLQNDQAEVLKYFHTSADTVDKINPKFLDEAKELLIERIR